MKKLLLSLFVGFVGIISFCNASQVIGLIDSTEIPSTPVNASSYTMVADIGLDGTIPRTVCINIHTDYTLNVCLESNPSSNCGRPQLFWADWVGNYYCFVQGGTDRYFKVISEGNGNVYGSYFFLTDLLDEDLPEMSSLECQSKYSLIPIGEVNQNYCEINGLCPSCPDLTGFGFSSFFIKKGDGNWNELSGTENYFVYLPEYLGYNFEYSNQGRDLDFTVGVATDTGYINNINAIQNSKPSQEDLNKLVSEVLPLFVPGLAVILLLYFIFRFIKKVF